MAKLIPQLSAIDVDGYVRFLSEAFGFEVISTWRDPNDPIDVNVEVEFQGVVVGIGRRRVAHRAAKDPAAPNVGLYVIVDDVDAHYRRACSARAKVIWDIADQPFGHRMYAAADPEGYEWCFATPLSDKNGPPLRSAAAEPRR
jgi:uncharacterized glyoxalase superfamily protein PhnB